MRVAVFQSLRTTNVPAWQQKCLTSVREWAAARDVEYRFLDDSFFERCPDWYREKVQSHKLLMSDLARLIVARELHQEGFETAIWVDADVLVISPQGFDAGLAKPQAAVEKVQAGFAFCRELWVAREGNAYVGWSRINNAVCAFARGEPFLDFYIDAVLRLVRERMNVVDPLAVGTKFLTGLNELTPVPVIAGVATLSPVLVEPLSRGELGPLREYRKKLDGPIVAANLCGSFRGKNVQGVLMSDAVYEGAVEQLLSDAGREISHAPV